MSSVVERETALVKSVIEDVVDLEKAKQDLDNEHPIATDLIEGVVERRIEAAPTVRVSVAAKILGLTPPTVNKWTDAGLLREVEDGKERQIDTTSILRIEPLVREVRGMGLKRNLMSAVIARIDDDAMLRNPDLKIAIDQWERGQLDEITPED